MKAGSMYRLKGGGDKFVFLITEVGDVVDGIPGVVGDKVTYSTVEFHVDLAATLSKDAVGEEVSAVPAAVFNRIIDEQIEQDCEGGVDTDKEENKELTELMIKLQGGSMIETSLKKKQRLAMAEIKKDVAEATRAQHIEDVAVASYFIGMCLAGILCLSDTVEAWTAAFTFCVLGLGSVWLAER